MALLSVPTVSGKVLPLFDGEYPEIGEKIYAIGNPKGLSGTISEGIVSGLRSDGESKLIQITAPISPGSSGGPVINNEGEVVGVTVGTIASGQNLNFAIPSSLVRVLINNDNYPLSDLNIEHTEYDSSEIIIDINFAVEVKIIDSYGKFSFTIINNLPYYIKNISLLIIKVDKNGLPIDYFEEIYFSDGIRPLLPQNVSITYREMENPKYYLFSDYYSYNWKIRILDFDVIRD